MQTAFATSGLTGTRIVTQRPSLRRSAGRAQVKVAASNSGYSWLNKEPLALLIGSAAWAVPASSPAPSFGGGSLFGAFMERISANLATFPQGPALDDKFWLYMVTWHVGLFVCLTLAQIGVQGRKQEYW